MVKYIANINRSTFRKEGIIIPPREVVKVADEDAKWLKNMIGLVEIFKVPTPRSKIWSTKEDDSE